MLWSELWPIRWRCIIDEIYNKPSETLMQQDAEIQYYLHETPFHFSFLDLRQSVGLFGRVISSSLSLYLYTNTETHTQTLNIHALSGFRTHDPGSRASENSACLRPLG
jgi:hypothetical protein